jgi:hypothetical protein
MPIAPKSLSPFSIAWPATYSCTGPHWWSHQSQCLCFLDSGCKSSDGSLVGRSPWHSGYSDEYWYCSSDLGNTGLQASGRTEGKISGKRVFWGMGWASHVHHGELGDQSPKFLPGFQPFPVMPELKPRKNKLSRTVSSSASPFPLGTKHNAKTQLGCERTVPPGLQSRGDTETVYFVSPCMS